MDMRKRVRSVWRILPIVGSLHMCTAANFAEASKELAISMLISMSPVYVGAFALYVAQDASPCVSYLSCVGVIVRNGELFIYAAAVLAPVVYIVSKDRYDVCSFPGKFTFIGIVILVTILSTCIFTIERVKAQVIPSNVLLMSLVVFAAAVAVFYLALVHNNRLLPDPANVMRDNEKNFTARLQQHRRSAGGK